MIDKLSKPSGISEEEALKRAAAIIERAVKNGLTEVEVFRFPNALCTDKRRAINNGMEPGWESTLTGLPKEMYSFSGIGHLRPIGYKIRVPGRRLLWRRAGRHRSHAEMGLNEFGDRAVMQRGINRNIAKASKRRSARHSIDRSLQ